ncbi:MAG: hypothetical protein IT435_11530 [Phycisphaerales bacterium]|nr:hypothetical protein [Phycisphaerales bacterium]
MTRDEWEKARRNVPLWCDRIGESAFYAWARGYGLSQPAAEFFRMLFVEQLPAHDVRASLERSTRNYLTRMFAAAIAEITAFIRRLPPNEFD